MVSCDDVQTLVSHNAQPLHASPGPPTILIVARNVAGDPQVFAQTCSGICYNDYVIGSPSNYDNAYFEVRSVRVFGTSSAVDIPPGANGTRRENTSTRVVGIASAALATLVFLMAL